MLFRRGVLVWIRYSDEASFCLLDFSGWRRLIVSSFVL